MVKRTTPQPAVARVEYRVRFVEDPDASFEECNGEARPLTAEEYADNEYMKDDGNGGRVEIPYDEYLAYYGNPERHVYLMSEIQHQCPCCKHWEDIGGSIGGIDLMDDDKALRAIGSYWDRSRTSTWFTPEEITAKAAELGYLADVAREGLDEARRDEKG